MKAQITSKSAFSVIGIEGSGKADEGPRWIGPLWEQAHKRRAEIEHLLKPTGEAWGLMSATDEYLAAWKEEGKYLAGWELKADMKPPAGWSVWKLPEQTFAVVACTMATYGEAYRFVVQQFLPKEGYVQVGATHEFYPGEFRDIKKDAFCLYITVKKKHE
jgi:predicted transcriptional regulator YdeE